MEYLESQTGIFGRMESAPCLACKRFDAFSKETYTYEKLALSG